MYWGCEYVVNPTYQMVYEQNQPFHQVPYAVPSPISCSKLIHEMCVNMRLGEAALEEMKLYPAKTPITVLQELLSRWGMRPFYNCVQTRGRSCEPYFQYLIYLKNEFIAIGSGRSKKEAKHGAAKNFLDLLVGNVSSEPEPETVQEREAMQVIPDVIYNQSTCVDKLMGNPIGWVQQLCIWRNWPLPQYNIEKEEGLPHQRQFTIACCVLEHKQTGTAKKKRLAKRIAAFKMWQILHK